MTALDIEREVAATPDNGSGPSVLRFKFDADGSGQNTRIDYKLTDNMAGQTVKGSVVLQGRISADDVLDMAAGLQQGRLFDPNEAGVPDLSEKMPTSWTDAGETFHSIERISYTSQPAPGYLPTAEQFAGVFSDQGYDY
jgi:hypothetical protein